MKKQNFLYVFDDNYAPYAGISILSLLSNAKSDADITIFCGGMNVSDENAEKIEHTVKSHGQHVKWLDCSEAIEIIQSCNTGEWNGSKATWLKVFLPWMLPDDVKQILYIDSDTLVHDDLSEIFPEEDSDECGAPVAAVLESVDHTLGPGLLLDDYFNAGVLLIDVNYWKKPNFKEDFTKHLVNNVEKYRANEQCLINDFFRGQIRKLPMKYNVQGFHYCYNEKTYLSVFNGYDYYDKAEISAAKENPAIIHFFRILGDYPWVEGNFHPVADDFHKWKELSEWKELPDIKAKRSFTFKVERILYKILPKKMFLQLFCMIAKVK